MPDAVNLVKSLFPTARVTSTKRSPTSDLGRKNPRSYHNIGRAIDIVPIPGIKFKDYVSSLKNAGLDVVEAIEEVGKGRSKHATGDHWHVAYATGSKAPKAAVKAPKAAQMASVDVEKPDMPDAPDFDIEAETESNFASLLSKIGAGKKKRSTKRKMPGILDGLI
jgi:hypothetical protein